MKIIRYFRTDELNALEISKVIFNGKSAFKLE